LNTNTAKAFHLDAGEDAKALADDKDDEQQEYDNEYRNEYNKNPMPDDIKKDADK